jgi:hypothetical protein
MATTNDDIQHLMDKVKQLEQGEQLDLSSDEDLSIGIMNLISIEEHLFFSANKTGNPEYYEILREVREMRKDLLKRIITEYEGEVWCISKHLLSGSMRLMEVGTKMLGKGDNTAAYDMFGKAYNLYSLFWGLNLGLVAGGSKTPTKNNKPAAKSSPQKVSQPAFVPTTDTEKKLPVQSSMFSKLGEVVKRAVDCCKE